jgi:membrane protein DedA with SNARE-associated domain
VSWLAIVLLGAAGFFIGGAISFWRNQSRRRGAIILTIAAVGCIIASFLWAWQPSPSG